MTTKELSDKYLVPNYARQEIVLVKGKGSLLYDEDGTEYKVLPCEKGELVRIEVETENDIILLTDYQSCGKQWLKKNAIMSVWLNEE